MGAMPWQEMAPWHSDPKAALEALQIEFLRRNYDLPSLLDEFLDDERQAMELAEADGDPYDLLEECRQNIAFLEDAKRRGAPAEPRQQVRLLQQIYANSGASADGIGNVMDVISVSDEGGVFVTRRLRDEELVRMFGTATPTRSMAEQSLGMLADETGRAESFCFPVFDESGNPVGWWFAGYSVD